MADRLETVEISTGDDPLWSVIWLHGLGADGRDFEPIVPELELPQAVRFVFPHAPVRPVTINGGLPMRAWYDIVSLDRGAAEDEAGIRTSAGQVEQLIQVEADRGVPSTRVIVAGFSQGGAIALQLALRHPSPLAGLIALSTYLPLADSVAAEKTPATRSLPIFMGHGTQDPTIPLTLGAHSRDQLESEGYQVDWHTYPMGHSVSSEEISDINLWLGARFQGSA